MKMRFVGKGHRVRLIVACASLLVLVLAVCCGHGVRLHEQPDGPSTKVLTWNVNWGGPRPEAVVRALLEADADIVCLQETTPQWEAYLRPRLSELYPDIRFRHALPELNPDTQTPMPVRLAGGMAVLSKTKGREVAWIESLTTWFGGWILVFETPAGPLQMMNVHLQPSATDDGEITISAYFGTGDRRLAEIERFAEKLQADVPTVVAGDFNEQEGGDAIEWLEGKGLTNSLPEFDRDTDTWRWDTSLIKLRQRFDHILYTPSLYCYSAEVLNVGASDHLPVVAVFRKR